jgi:hypothetical protein
MHKADCRGGSLIARLCVLSRGQRRFLLGPLSRKELAGGQVGKFVVAEEVGREECG